MQGRSLLLKKAKVGKVIIDAICQECDGKGYTLELAEGCDFDCNSHFENVACDVCGGEGIVEVYESQE